MASKVATIESPGASPCPESVDDRANGTFKLNTRPRAAILVPSAEQTNPRSIRMAGVDEAGRGPLAGPVAVAAVILDPARPIAGLNDSKQLSAAKREACYAQIIERALACCVVLVEVDEIDRLNILQATLTGMSRAVAGLFPAAHHAVIDGNRLPADLPCPGRFIIGGDALEPAISAASILAKVTRDRTMVALDAIYPGYGFAVHKGYPTLAHRTALARLGPCPQHRRSFAPVRRLLGAWTVETFEAKR